MHEIVCQIILQSTILITWDFVNMGGSGWGLISYLYLKKRSLILRSLCYSCKSGCPQSWLTFRGHCYKLFKEKKTWDAAAEACANQPGPQKVHIFIFTTMKFFYFD